MNRSHNQPYVNHTQKMNRNYNHQVNRFDSRRNFFNGQCFSCHNFGHKATQCVSYETIMLREARNQRNVTGIKKSSYNNFYLLENEIECSICNNFGCWRIWMQEKILANISKGENSIKSQDMEKEGISNRMMWYNLVYKRTRK